MENCGHFGGNGQDRQGGIPGMPSPPINFSLPPPPSSPELLSAEAAEFVPMSSILNQTRNVLYNNNQQNMCNSSHYKCVPVPTENVNMTTTQSSGQGYVVCATTMNPTNTMNNMMNTTMNTTMTGNRGVVIPNIVPNTVPPGIPSMAPAPNSDTAPTWALHMMNRLGQIESHMSTQTINWRNLDTTLQNQNLRITNIEQQVKNMNAVKHEVTKATISVSNIQDDLSSLNRKMNDYDYSINTFSDICDEAVSNQKSTETVIEQLCERVENLEKNQSTIQPKLQKFETEITDLQCRSMRDNLIFVGIQEPEYSEGDTAEDAELTLRDFLNNEMHINRPIQFHRVHRLNHNENNKNQNYENVPRPIVAKFERFKDREYVRHQASKTLIGKPFGVREQFPRAIEEKRKRLYPEMKRARSNPENNVRLVKDRLYINNVQFKPSTDNDAETESNTANRPRNSINQTQNESRNVHYTRTFQNSKYKYNGPIENGARPKYGQRGPSGNFPPWSRARESEPLRRMIDFSIETSNKFSCLSNDGYDSDRSTSRKHKASSPADGDMTVKKQQIDNHERDQGNPTDENTEMETEYQQCDPPLGSSNERTMPISPQSSVELVRTPEAMPLGNDPRISADKHNDVTASQQSTEA